ncbi:hypothetical protein MTR_2g059760 [Medicago truncatula]|uniref:Uncharacterized protein n=1 Tax=Medicago truncatula TaxID=3880 RepID=A0A072V9I9_MEDTR|nr:hypothetical protein MTR_2g059760 [Medicago truncatula]
MAKVTPCLRPKKYGQNRANCKRELLLTHCIRLRHTGTNIGWIESWSQRKGLGADLVQKYEDSETKICLPKVRSLARPVLALARPCHPPESLLLLLLRF